MAIFENEVLGEVFWAKALKHVAAFLAVYLMSISTFDTSSHQTRSWTPVNNLLISSAQRLNVAYCSTSSKKTLVRASVRGSDLSQGSFLVSSPGNLFDSVTSRQMSTNLGGSSGLRAFAKPSSYLHVPKEDIY